MALLSQLGVQVGGSMRRSVRNILLSTVAVGALVFATAASAAPPPKRTLAAPLPAFSWTGCYVGVQGGYGWGKNDFTHSQTITHTNAPSSSFVGTAGIDTGGAVFGGQVGCDWQATPNFVFGIQGMFSGADLEGNANSTFGGTLSSFDVRTKWLSSLTGSIGVTNIFGPTNMLYIKGGGAWAGQQFDRSAGPAVANVPTNFSYDISGWTVGGGVKWMFMQNWIGFVEFNHYDFGKKTLYSGSVTQTGLNGFTETDVLTMKSRIETVTVGISYKFFTH